MVASLRRMFLSLLLRLLALVVLLRGAGLVARRVRDQHLTDMLQRAVAVTEAAGLEVFLDWSSLLGVWREAGGILWDEEDADLGLVLPAGGERGAGGAGGADGAGGATWWSEETVADLLRPEFTGPDFEIRVEPGMVYVVPTMSRLHLDFYLVSREPKGGSSAAAAAHDGGNQGTGYVWPLWPQPTRADSHAASTHPRPVPGTVRLHGWPVPSDPEAYLTSIFGYTGKGATFNHTTMLYDPPPPPASPSSTQSAPDNQHGAVLQKLLELGDAIAQSVSRMPYELVRDVYFVTIMLPISESVRKAGEQHMDAAIKYAVDSLCGQGVALRDCLG